MNVAGTAHAAALGAPLVAFSTDYVFDGRKASRTSSLTARTRCRRMAAPSCTARPRPRTRGRPLVVAVRPDGPELPAHHARLGAERDEVEVVDDQRGCPTYVGHLAGAVRELVDGHRPKGIWHVASVGDCTWADLAEEIFTQAGLGCRVRRITSDRRTVPHDALRTRSA